MLCSWISLFTIELKTFCFKQGFIHLSIKPSLEKAKKSACLSQSPLILKNPASAEGFANGGTHPKNIPALSTQQRGECKSLSWETLGLGLEYKYLCQDASVRK